MPNKNIGQLGLATRQYEFKPESLNAEKRTVDIVLSTGSRGRRFGWFDDYYEELEVSERAVDLKRLNGGGAPFLDVHNRFSNDAVLGVFERAWIEDGKLLATIRFDETEVAQKRFNSIRNGILKNVSVGYSVREYEELEEKSEDGLAIFRAIDWEPQEGSLVPIGFDEDSKVRFDNNKTAPCKVNFRNNEEKGEKDMPEQTENKIVEKTIDVQKERQAAIESERTRVSKISKIASALNLSERGQELIDQGVSFDEASDVLTEMASKRSKETACNQRIEVGATDASKKREAIEKAILFRANRNMYKDNAKDNQFANAPLSAILRHMLGNGAEFLSNRKLVERGMNSTTDFPIILSNVAGKVLRDEFTLLGNNFEPIVKRATATDFKDIERDRLGDAESLDLVMEGEDYKYSTLSERKEVYRVAKYGKAFKISFEALVNDDLGAFQRMAQKIAVAAARRERDLIWDILINNPTMSDSVALFHATHANLAGSGGNLSDTTLADGYVAMMKQKNENGDYLNIPPAFLIVAPEYAVTAKKLVGTINPNIYTSVNPFEGMLTVIVEPKLSALNSGKSWFLSASPSLIDTIELAYLAEDGGLVIDEIPEVLSDSIIWKSRLVAGSAPIEYRGLYKNAGA